MSTGLSEATSEKENRQVSRRRETLGPPNGPVAISKADGVPCLEARLRTCCVTQHLLTLKFSESG